MGWSVKPVNGSEPGTFQHGQAVISRPFTGRTELLSVPFGSLTSFREHVP